MTKTIFEKDLSNNKIFISREFTAPVEMVWKAWTESELLEQWWAPKPWKAVSKTMDFREGGFWLYYMLGPDGTKSYARADFNNIVIHKKYEVMDAFCDEHGTPNSDIPGMHWKILFSSVPAGTKVDVEISFKSQADLEKIMELGFKEGFTAAHGNLDELLTQKKHA